MLVSSELYQLFHEPELHLRALLVVFEVAYDSHVGYVGCLEILILPNASGEKVLELPERKFI